MLQGEDGKVSIGVGQCAVAAISPDVVMWKTVELRWIQACRDELNSDYILLVPGVASLNYT